MPYTKIWGSLSLLIGAVVAVLALARSQWQQWLLLAVIAIWALWLALTVLLPYAQAKRQRGEYLQCEDAPGEVQPDGDMGYILLRHVNHRISAYLKSVYPNVRWEWREKLPERLIMEGGTGRIRVYGVPEYNFADVQLDPQGGLQCSMVKIVPLSNAGKAGEESGHLPPNGQPVDPRIWYEHQGRKVLSGLIADLNSRGHSSLEIDEDGAIHMEGVEEEHHPLPSFPEKVYWPQLVKVLEGEGLAAEVKEDTVAVTW